MTSQSKLVGLWALGLTAFLLLGMTTPNAFISGTTIRADEVNANFATIESAVTALEDRANAPGNIVGMARVISDGTMARGWMANGQMPTSVRNSVGEYDITFPGHTVNLNFRPVFASVVGSGSGWATAGSANGDARVYVHDAAGALANTAFWVFITNDIP